MAPIAPVRSHGSNPFARASASLSRSHLLRLSIGAACSLFALPFASAQGLVERISVSTGGGDPSGTSAASALTPDARFVGFRSDASNVVPGDTNGTDDLFLVDRTNGAIERIGVDSSGAQANGPGLELALSDNGQRIVFTSGATNLVSGDTNGSRDVFLRDRATGTTTRLNVTPAGAEVVSSVAWPAISGDGRVAAFACDANLLTGAPATTPGLYRIWVKDLATGSLTLASADMAGLDLPFPRYPSLSFDGRFVAFRSFTTATPVIRHAYVRDLLLGTLEIVTRNSAGVLGNQDSDSPPILSADGRYVAFSSFATNLVPGDTNGVIDVFLRDRLNGTTERLSTSSTGAQGNLESSWIRISPDARFVAFRSLASNLVADDTNGLGDTFLKDRVTGATLRVTGPDGANPNGISFPEGLSADGMKLVLDSAASNLVPAGIDGNATWDVYLVERASNVAAPYCTAKVDALGCLPVIAASGTASTSSAAPFTISASNLRSNARGRLYYSFAPSQVAFQGGTACIAEPRSSTRVLFSNGTPGVPDCSGSFQVEFNSIIQLGTDPELVPGTVVYAQFRYSDPGGAGGFIVGMTDALVFAIAP